MRNYTKPKSQWQAHFLDHQKQIAQGLEAEQLEFGEILYKSISIPFTNHLDEPYKIRWIVSLFKGEYNVLAQRSYHRHKELKLVKTFRSKKQALSLALTMLLVATGKLKKHGFVA